MPRSIDCPQEAFPEPATTTVPIRNSEQPTIAGGSETTSALDAEMTDNTLIFSEIDHLLATACALARYYERNSVCDAIVLAMRINRMDYEGRRLELIRREEQLYGGATSNGVRFSSPHLSAAHARDPN